MNFEDNPKSIKYYVKRYLIAHQDQFRGKQVIDFPAGSGVTSRVLKEIGAHPMPFDLFPEFFEVAGIKCQKADIREPIPVDGKAADYVICQEGIEHFSDQLGAFQEFNRILKADGSLIITTPNYSNIRSRLSYFLSESERYNKIMPPNELDSVWFSKEDQSEDFYLGHIFLIGIQKLRVLARLSGFEIADIQFTRARPTSTALLPFLYPFIFVSNWINYRRNLRGDKGLMTEERKKIYKELFQLGVNIKLLVDGHLFVKFVKKRDTDQVKEELQGYATRHYSSKRL